MPQNRAKAIAISITDEQDFRRTGGGSGDPNQPSSFKDKFNELTTSMRNRAKAVLRPQMDQSPALKQQFDSIVKGGLSGAIVAWKVLRDTRLAPKDPGL